MKTDKRHGIKSGMKWFINKLHFLFTRGILGSITLLYIAAGTPVYSDVTTATQSQVTVVRQSVIGLQSMAVLRCQYPDSTDVNISNAGLVAEMDEAENIWLDASYGQLDLSNSEILPTCADAGCSAFYTLPEPKSAYIKYNEEGESYTEYNKLMYDCMAAADNDVDFNNYYGVVVAPVAGATINLGSNQWGLEPAIDGLNRIPGVLLATPQTGYIAHELGHAFGLPHITPYPPTGIAGISYDIMASGGETNTNMVFKDHLGWISADRKYVPAEGSNTTVFLERSAQPTFAEDTYLSVNIPIPGTAGAEIVAESRLRVGRDAGLPHEGVVVHFHSPALNEFASVSDPDKDGDVNEASSFLSVGETFTMPEYGITLTVVGQSASGHDVSISYEPNCEGIGFQAEYYKNIDLTDLAFTRIDPTIQFDWGAGSPDPSMSNDNFSVRWTGELNAPFTGLYTFHADTDDGFRLWVGGDLLFDLWVPRCCSVVDSSIWLFAGQPYPITMEYFEQGGGAVAKLWWTDPNGVSIPISSCFVHSGSNQAPIANAGNDFSANEETLVSIDAFGSYDPDEGPSPLTYAWTQVAGPMVTLSSPSSVNPTFTAPSVAATEILEFEVNVCDGQDCGQDSVQVTIEPIAVGACTVANSVDLGGFGNATLLDADGCAMISAFPAWWNLGRSVRLIATSGTFPVPFTWNQQCSGAGGTGEFTQAWQSQVLPGTSNACPLFIDLNGSGNIKVRWY